MSVSGERIAVASDSEDSRGENSAGAVYILEPDGSGGWTIAARIERPPVPLSGDNFGRSLALDGDRLVVSAPDEGQRNGMSGHGALYVFEHQPDGTWAFTARLTSAETVPEQNVYSRLGYDVALDGDRIIASAFTPVSDSTTEGGVFTFEHQPDGTWQRETYLRDPGLPLAEPYTYFGFSVAVAGDRLLVGAYLSDAPDADENAVYRAGRAYIYHRTGSADGEAVWSLEAALLPDHPTEGAQMGWSSALVDGPDGTLALVSAPFGYGGPDGSLSGSGLAHIFAQTGDDPWRHVAALSPATARSGDAQGFCVGAAWTEAGPVVVASAPYASHSGVFRPGAAYVYAPDPSLGEWTDGEAWIEIARLLPSDPHTSQSMGLAGNYDSCASVGETGWVAVGNPKHRSPSAEGSVVDSATYLFDVSARIPVASENPPASSPLELAISPNPVRQLARITYALATPGAVRLSVHDALGREVAVLHDGRQLEGEHTAEWQPDGLAAGVYLVRLRAGEDVRTQRMTVVR